MLNIHNEITYDKIRKGGIYRVVDEHETLVRVISVRTDNEKIKLVVKALQTTDKYLTKSVYPITITNIYRPIFYEVGGN